LDLLRQRGPQRAGDIATYFPQISRPAVSKHLSVLKEADLVHEESRGRERWYALHAAPLYEMHSWLDHYTDFWQGNLATLKRMVEATPEKPTEDQEN
jgi:DNA-binding transcriptional ArsR family regulator